MLGTCLQNVREKGPLVHNITNYVTVNDVANVILACGASPIMSDEPQDVQDITAICGGLNINIGTLNVRTIEGMLAAGHKANELSHMVLLDPVGAGASSLRTNTAVNLMQEIKFDVIRGNISEIKTLAAGSGTTKGVDADVADAVTEENLDEAVVFAKAFSEKSGSIVAITGAIDLVSDGRKCYVIRNGRPEMGRITGTGCQLSGLMTAYLVANPEQKLEAAAAAVCTMGLAGEIGTDTFGHKMLTGSGKYLENLVKERIGVKVRSIELNVCQRCSSEYLSATDLNESENAGIVGVQAALKGETGKMITFIRNGDLPYELSYETADVNEICNMEKAVPSDWITEDGCDVTEAFIQYARPLIQGKVVVPEENGLPLFAYRK